MTAERFAFAFDPQFRLLLAAMGVTPRRAYVAIDDESFTARFGPWTCVTPTANLRETCVTGPYSWFKVIGARGSFVDRGLTFGSSTSRGVCVLFREPVRGLDPFGLMHHPGLTVTVKDPEAFVAAIRRAANINSPRTRP